MSPEKFTRESEQFLFFNKMWEFGKYAASCDNKEMYLNISKIIIDELRKTDFTELRDPLNKFYTFMSEYWNIPIDNTSEWTEFINHCDEYLGNLPENMQKFMGDILYELQSGLQKRAKDNYDIHLKAKSI